MSEARCPEGCDGEGMVSDRDGYFWNCPVCSERDEDGLDAIEALVADAVAAEPHRSVHEGGDYYAERIIRRAIAQGALILAKQGGEQ